MASAFQNCINLDTLTLPTTMGLNVDMNNAFNSSDGPDITFSGKYLISKVTHSIKRAKSGKIEYGCNIIGIKDSLGEE